MDRVESTCRLRDAIPNEDLDGLTLSELVDKYIIGDDFAYDIWFEELVPVEFEAIFPTTDCKLNYLSFTRRLASVLAHAHIRVDGYNKMGKEVDNEHAEDAKAVSCCHDKALHDKRERFAAVINRFLDLHQILRDS